MSAVKTVAEALETVLRGVDGLRVYRDPGARIDPPAAILGPPLLRWEGMCREMTSARFPVYVVRALDGRALERFWELAPLVAEAVDSVPDAVVLDATPGVFNAGGSDLPSYDLQIEVAL